MNEPVIVASARTPIGKAGKGCLRDVRADDLAAAAVSAALTKVPELDPAELDDLLLGCGSPGGEQGWNLARMVALLLGLDTLPGTTVTRHCASSLQAARMAAHAIRAGEGDAFVVAGVEAASRHRYGSAESSGDPNPLYAGAARRTAGHAERGDFAWTDPRALGERPDAYLTMIQTAEYVARLRGVTREAMDAFALRSQLRAAEAAEAGFWAAEITPVPLPGGGVADRDDGPRTGVTLERLAALKPVLHPAGRITAGNACPVNDGAAALVMMSDRRARELGVPPLGRVVATGLSALSPEVMGLGPVEAARQALRRAEMSVGDVDMVELNEAFAAQAIPCADDLGVPPDRLNVHGGAIAMGHPPGMTGARLIGTLLHGLRDSGGTVGLVTMCVGGGQGMAAIVERL
ncbi:acetyl-CoA C-acyltransferase [Spongiactinospora gelatinilytica]|uniref:acetyl-CoA C-acyltransferase n=1 Tax=Spongiactinospora gelatinilytica TaxID=2666298 RepID=A0A2W2GW79_9ACTN|nr:acetyl-CoA C-acetyltransferase [Spongiactinospora gelatinilytica]PZG41508.1 acetyl-CoA C-acyltransferase [Spongiactinospora gelatinilytica]